MILSRFALPETCRALERFRALRRPRLLIRAARFGLADYRRERDLRRLLGEAAARTGASRLDRLLDLEAGIDAARCAGLATYRPAAHVAALTALMFEARLMMAQDHRPDATTTAASGPDQGPADATGAGAA